MEFATMMIRVLVQTTLLLAAMGAILFCAGGDWLWPQAWFFLAEFGLCSFAVSFWLLRHDPALLASRMPVPVRRDQMPWDRIFMAAASIAFIAWPVLIALDARRFGWSHVPLWVQALGAGLIALGMAAVWHTFRFNTFAAPQVRLQTERGHRVIADGPYAIVRHPKYAGSILYLLGMPLLLGSWWGVAVVPLIVAGLAPRAVGEKRMLRRDLPGYEEYMRRVLHRLVPGIW
jgi:protein-S-isoprenylcysteine O-methyltransferase Ste14